MKYNPYDIVREEIIRNHHFTIEDISAYLQKKKSSFKPYKIRKGINERVSIVIEDFRDNDEITEKQIMLGCMSKEFQKALILEDIEKNNIPDLKRKCEAKKPDYIVNLFTIPDHKREKEFNPKTRDMLALYCGYLGWSDLDVNNTFTYKELKTHKILDSQKGKTEKITSAIISSQKEQNEVLKKDITNVFQQSFDEVIKKYGATTSDNFLFYIKKFSDDDATLFRILSHISSLEKQLIAKESFINCCKNHSESRYLEREINELRHKQDIYLKELEDNITQHPLKFITPDFLEFFSRIYYYEWEDTNSLKIAKKLNDIGNFILNYIESDDSPIALKLRVDSLKTNWAIGENTFAKKVFERAYDQVKLLDATNAIPKKKLQQHQFSLLDYGCGFNVNSLIEFRDFADNYLGEQSDITNMKINSFKCSACRLIRVDEIDEAKLWIEKTEQEMEKYFNDEKITSEQKYTKLSYLYFIKGAYLFKTNQFEDAEKLLFWSLTSFDNAKIESDHMERAFIFYMLYKIKKIKSDESCEKYAMLALNIMRNSVRRNYCLFDFNEVLKELNQELIASYYNFT